MTERGRSRGALAAILTVMIITLILTFLAFLVELTTNVSRGPFEAGTPLLTNLLVVGLGLVIAVIVFYFILRGSITVGVRVVVSIFVFSAIMSLLLFVKLFLTMYGASTASLFVIISIIAYLASFLGVMAIFDVLSRKTRNALFAVCSGVLGTFTGVLVPSAALVFVLVMMVGLDLILTRRHTVEKTTKVLEDYERMVILKLSYAGRNWAIGLADLLSYSMLIANCFTNFGLVISVASLILVLLGFFLGSLRAKEGGQVAGLPFAIGLGMIPLLFSMVLPFLP